MNAVEFQQRGTTNDDYCLFRTDLYHSFKNNISYVILFIITWQHIVASASNGPHWLVFPRFGYYMTGVIAEEKAGVWEL